MARVNTNRCHCRPLYGSDVLGQVQLAMAPCVRLKRTTFSGYANCQCALTEALPSTTREYFSITNLLKDLIKSRKDHLMDLQDILRRYAFALPIKLMQF